MPDWWDLGTDLFGGGGGGSNFNLFGGGGFQWPSGGGGYSMNFDPSWFKMDIGDYGDFGGVFGAAGGGKGGGLQSFLPNNLGGYIDLAKFGLGAGLGIKSMMDNASYQNAQKNYIRARQQQEKEYNDAVLAYQKQRQEWESEMMGRFGETMGGFQEGMGAFQENVTNIMNQQLEAARPLLEQSKELLEPAVAALAKGEVPQILAPVLDQVKARARAAIQQQYESAGIDSGTALAAAGPQIDQQATQMLLQMATQMLTGGTGLATTGGQFLNSALGAAQAGMSPLVAEFQLMMQALNGLFGGGMPGLASGTPNAAPTA